MKQPQLPAYTATPRSIGTIAASLEAEGSTVIPENIPLGSGLYDDVELQDIGAAKSQKVRCCLIMLDLLASTGAHVRTLSRSEKIKLGLLPQLCQCGHARRRPSKSGQHRMKPFSDTAMICFLSKMRAVEGSGCGLMAQCHTRWI